MLLIALSVSLVAICIECCSWSRVRLDLQLCSWGRTLQFVELAEALMPCLCVVAVNQTSAKVRLTWMYVVPCC